MNFDPMTGEPIKKKFDPMTGEPINQEPESQTAEPETAAEFQTVAKAEPEAENQVAVDTEPEEELQTAVEAEEPQTEVEAEAAEELQPEAEVEAAEEIQAPEAEAVTEVLTNQTAQQPEMSFDSMTGQPVGMEPKKKGFLKSKASKIILAVAVATVIVCGAAAFAFSSIFASSSDKVLKAIENTIADKGELTKAFDVKDIVKSNEYTVGFSMASEGMGVDAACVVGKEGKQITGTMDMGYSSSFDFAMNLTKDEFQMQIPYVSDKVFTYNYKEENTGYLMQEMDADDIKLVNKMFEYVYEAKYDDETDKEFYNAVLDEYKSLEFKEVKAAKFEVNGKDRSCDGYETVISKENIQNLLDAYEESTVEAVEEMEEFMSDLDSSYMTQSYASTFDELKKELEDMPDVTATFYLYDSKLACVELEPEGDIAIQIQFLGGDRRAQNIRVVDEDGNVGIEVVGEKDGSTENMELFVDDESVLCMNYDSKSGAFTFSAAEASISGTIESDRNGLEITIDNASDEYDDYDFEGSIFLKKGGEFTELDGETFNIGNASEDEAMDLMTEIMDSLN